MAGRFKAGRRTGLQNNGFQLSKKTTGKLPVFLGPKDSGKIRIQLMQKTLFKALKKKLFTKPRKFSLLEQYIYLGKTPERAVLRQKIKKIIQESVSSKIWGNAIQLNFFLDFLNTELNAFTGTSKMNEASKMDAVIDFFSERIKELKQKQFH